MMSIKEKTNQIVASLKQVPNNLRSLPLKSKTLIGLIVVASLAVVMPLFVWAVVTLNFNPFEKAASGEPFITPTPTPWYTSTPYSSPTPFASYYPSSSPTACVRNLHSIEMSPQTQSGLAGSTLTYTAFLKNNNSSGCGKSQFTFSSLLPYANWTAAFSPVSVNIDGQSSISISANFTSAVTAPVQSAVPVSIIAKGPDGNVVATSGYQVIGNSNPTPMPTPSYCNNLCGNKTCESVVCLGQGCPCPETQSSCPQDCLPKPTVTATPMTANHKPTITTSYIPPFAFMSRNYDAYLRANDVDINDFLTAQITGLPDGLSYTCIGTSNARGQTVTCHIFGKVKAHQNNRIVFTVSDQKPGGTVSKTYSLYVFNLSRYLRY